MNAELLFLDCELGTVVHGLMELLDGAYRFRHRKEIARYGHESQDRLPLSCPSQQK